MSASCSADREMVYADSGDVFAVHVSAQSSDRYAVNCSWSASNGAVDGTGADVRWSSAGRQTGPYTIKVRVENAAMAQRSASPTFALSSAPIPRP